MKRRDESLVTTEAIAVKTFSLESRNNVRAKVRETLGFTYLEP